MRTDPQLEPETKEIWTGIRSRSSMVSELQNQINALRSRVSGIIGYQDFLEQSSVDSFDSYESELKTKAGNYNSAGESDVAAATQTARDTFSSFSDFTGDASNDTGIFGLAGYDGYRTYLTDNGAGELAADQHNRTIQTLFSADALFVTKVTEEFDDYDDLKQWLIDNGWTEDEAAELINKLKEQFASFEDLQDFISELESLEELLNEFPHNEGGTAGQPGVKVRDGKLYLFGNEIHFRQQDPDEQFDPDPPSDGGVDWTMQTSDDRAYLPNATQTVKATGTATASGNYTVSVSVIVNGRVVASKTVGVLQGQTSVSFDLEFSEPGEYNVVIGNSGSITITVRTNERI
jgi:hypothetical protein